EPKPVMMAEFGLTDRQAEAILNMRLRSLRKLEEMELRREHSELLKEQADLQALLDSPAKQRTRLKRDLNALRKDYAETTALGRRRTTIAEAAPTREFNMDAMIEKAPVTVILSQRGWIRGASGHEPLDKDFKYKEGDGQAFVLHAQTTDKLLIACDNGRFYTLGADKLPSARGFGEPLRSMLDIDADAAIIAMLVHKPGGQLLLASNLGRGFAAESAELLAETRKGRGVMGTKPGVKLALVREIAPEHDHIAVVGDNRKLVIFSLSELPVMAKGQGVTLQRYRDGGLADAITLKLEDGLSWAMGGDTGRTRTEKDVSLWKVARGAAGRMPPNGFPRDNKF
ncbi:MAG: DNA topoisomerase IV subunit A, partial [Sphingomonadales bacterium]|nr:DNA topoisomerase IV subunit A [Sphingomonadales bacterium]